MPEVRIPLSVALLYPTSQLGGPMRDALRELGAAVVYEAMAASIDRDALEGSGARVVIVNLGADSDDYIDTLYDVLDAGDYQVVFNEAQVSDQLSGWDHARWARNLAAKILSQPEMAEPPRPPGAEPIPTPVQTAALIVPTAEKPGPAVSPAPAPTIDDAPAEPANKADVAPLTRPATADAPTVVLQVPDEFKSAPVTDEDMLDFADLAAFSALSSAADDTPTHAAFDTQTQATQVGETIEVAADTDTSFAAELDALFASTDNEPASVDAPQLDARAPIAAPAMSDTTDLGFDLPDDFNLIDIPSSQHVDVAAQTADDGDEALAFDLPQTAFDDEPRVADSVQQDELSVEFPAIFDQLDASAAEIPIASDNTFKPAALPDETLQADQSVAAPQWNLEPLHEPAMTEARQLETAEDFGIETIAPEDFLAHDVAEAAPPASVDAPSSAGLTLELMPMEEAIAPASNYSHENWLDEDRPAQKLQSGNTIARVVVLGASIGGPEAVRDFLSPLPAGFPVLFVVAQHMGDEFLQLMAAQLRRSIALTVREPTHGEQVGSGEVLIVPTTHRVKVNLEGIVTLEQLPGKLPYSPSIDQVLRDMADRFGNKSAAIIFSGMAHDAIEGSRHMKTKGGSIWAQDPQSCVVSSMVDGVSSAGLVDFTGTPAQLAEKMIADFGAK